MRGPLRPWACRWRIALGTGALSLLSGCSPPRTTTPIPVVVRLDAPSDAATDGAPAELPSEAGEPWPDAGLADGGDASARVARRPAPRRPALFAPADVFGGRTCVRIGGFDPRASKPEDRGLHVCGLGPRLAAGYPCGNIWFRPREDGGIDLEFVQSPVPADVYAKYGPSPGDRVFLNPRCRETASLERDGDSYRMQGVPLYESEAECLSQAFAGPAFPVITRSAPDLTPPCWNMLLHDMTRYDADLRRLRGGQRK